MRKDRKSFHFFSDKKYCINHCICSSCVVSKNNWYLTLCSKTLNISEKNITV